MTFLDELKLEMPVEFPAGEFTEFMRFARRKLLEPKSDAWREFAGASNLIGWRFRSTFEALDRYQTSWSLHGVGASFEQLYEREYALFSFFTSGVSCVDATSYGIHALASHENVFGLPFDDAQRRRCSPLTLRKALAHLPAAAELERALGHVVDAPEWSVWCSLRNRMNHRSNLPRNISLAVGGPAPTEKDVLLAATSSTEPFDASPSQMLDLARWLAVVLGGCLRGATMLGVPE